MKRLLLLFAIGLSLVAVSSVSAQSTLALQEKCAEGAKKFFLDRISGYGGEWGFFNDKGFGRGYNDFISHYNKKLHKCFIRIEFHSFSEGKTKRALNVIDVWNVFEGTHIASLSTSVELLIDCAVAGKTCNSPSEFEALIKPYMEE